MTVQPPDPADMARVVERYGLGLDEEDLSTVRARGRGPAELLGRRRRAVRAVRARHRRSARGPDREDDENPYNAWYVTTDISEGAQGPLTGRTVAIKDNTMVAGVPMMNGSATVEGFVPTRDATVVTRLLAAGATIAGKAVCEDLCFSGGSHTSRTGPVRNPWDETRSAGGSSSGSAALVAGGVVDLATGGDQGGSVRIPASYTGIVGHKPTHGLVPYTGAFPIEQTIDHLGPMARTVADAALVLSVLAGPDGQDPRQPRDLEPQDFVAALGQGAQGLRVGVVQEGFAAAQLRRGRQRGRACCCRGAARRRPRRRGRLGPLAPARLEDLGRHRHRGRDRPDGRRQRLRAELAGPLRPGADRALRPAVAGGRQPVLRDGQAGPARRPARARPRARGALRHGAQPRAPAASGLRRGAGPLRRPASCRRRRSRPHRSPQPVLPARRCWSGRWRWSSNTDPFDVTGHPACSVPAGLANGLPTGMMIIGKRFDDATVLRVAQAYEAAVGGFPAPPGLAG